MTFLKKIQYISLLSIVVLLTACGGGGGGNTDSVSTLSGEQLYINNCQSCHGEKGSGGSNSNVQEASAEFILNRIVEVAIMQNIAITNNETDAIVSYLSQFRAKWSWIKSSPYAGKVNGVYGTKGVAASKNHPGSRTDAVSWTDSNGDFWLFGGTGFDQNSSSQKFLNDLWKFDGVNWTWVSGQNIGNVNGVYTTIDTPHPENEPGGRRGANSWIDSNGNLNIFGGYGYMENGSPNYLNELWKFDGTNWTYISYNGSNLPSLIKRGIYNNKGNTDANNQPGGRVGANLWIDAKGIVWLFGGEGYDINLSTGLLNDLWKYDGQNWTWVEGSPTKDEVGKWGKQGLTTDLKNSVFPSARVGSSSWIDNNGTLWLFGGYDQQKNTMNDLWKYEPKIDKWTWMSGYEVTSKIGEYGTKGKPNQSNNPGPRQAASSWVDSKGNAWLFGGNGYDSKKVSGYLNDLWRWDGTNWTWMSGEYVVNTSGHDAGIKDPAAPIGNGQANSIEMKAIDLGLPPVKVPAGAGARQNAISWIDSNDKLWLFGGYGIDHDGSRSRRSDMWYYQPAQ